MSRSGDFDIKATPELARVLHLPRRNWEDVAAHNRLDLRMTTAFRVESGTQVMRPVQAAALAELHDIGGLLAPIPVGGGKTLISYLAPLILEARRPVLIIPAALKEKTRREFRALMHHWVAHPTWFNEKSFDAHCLTYQKLGRESGKDLLNDLRPDLIIADEVHKLKSRDAAVTKRMFRYMIAHPRTMFCGMSGTITKRSLMDYWHLCYWALKTGMPMPRIEAEAERWAEALDERKTEAISRRGPGALLRLCTEGEVQKLTEELHSHRNMPITNQMEQTIQVHNTKLAIARAGYQRRLRDTPGVISVNNPQLVGCSLEIQRLDWDPGEEARRHLAHLRESWETPNGDTCVMPADVWRHAREIACGFYYRWDPPAPEKWLTARRGWNWFLREILLPGGQFYAQFVHLHLDSPMQVSNAITAGKIVFPALQEAQKTWFEIRASFKPHTVATWVSTDIVENTVSWARKHHKGIIWTEHLAFGKAVAKALDTGFCGQKGLDAHGRMIEEYDGDLVVASVAANHEGRNLQAWNRNLIVTATPTGRVWEQLLGRTHRPGQLEDTVYADYVCACTEQIEGFDQVRADAMYIQSTTGQQQKVLYADYIR